jgi:sugar (pentulose or hexulose) kinase
MAAQRVTAVFDIGRTNKKFFLFDDDFREVHREYVRFDELTDEDGYPCDDLEALRRWLRQVFHRILEADNYDVQAINFSSYGASFVHVGAEGEVVAPLYNYTKPLNEEVTRRFYDKYGPVEEFTDRTGSPPSGMLNSGMQLYWLKHYRPETFARIKYSLHLPQYLSYVFTGIPISEYTSIGCHTALWDYTKQDYHDWVYAEDLHQLLPPIVSTETSINMNYNGKRMQIGVGIHDSSSALLPYIRSQHKPFLLLSTGTWSVALNPFASEKLSTVQSPHTVENSVQNCVNYMRIDGKPVRATRLYLGQEYKTQINRLAEHFGVATDRHKSVTFDYGLYRRVTENYSPRFHFAYLDRPDNPPTTDLVGQTYEHAYHQLLVELVREQKKSILAALGKTKVRKLFVDGGFSDNKTFLHLLSHHFRDLQLRTTDASLGSALGAAICISDKNLNSKFLKHNYGVKKHQPFVVTE